MPVSPPSVVPVPPAGVDPATWWTGKKRTPLAVAAAPLLIAALRRIAALDPSAHATRDAEALDVGRVTLRRLAAATSWNALHPVRPRPFLYRLRDVGYVLRGVGLIPSVVHQTRVSLGIPADADDDTLMACAHLSAFTCFGPAHLTHLHADDGWTIADLTAWSQRYGYEHFETAFTGGYGWAELGQLLRDDNVPSAQQIEFVVAMARTEPIHATA